MTLRQAINQAASLLASQNELRATALRDAELILLHVLDATRTALFTEPDRSLSAEQYAAYTKLVARRITCEPIQYITGKQEFYGLELRVSPAVLIPRPETELLVETALEILPRDRPLLIADVGTGSGAIAIAIAHNLPLARLIALDISVAALSVARENATAHSLLNRIDFVESDLLQDATPDKCLDAVLSNPPYVAESDRESLHPEVRDHEPASALFAGPEGLDIYARLIPQAFRALKPQGLLVLELGYGQRDALANLLKPWDEVRFREDLQGIPRAALARKPA